MIEFFVPCDPPTVLHHRKQILKRGRHLTLCDTPQLVATKLKLKMLFIKYRPKKPIEGPLQLTIEITFRWVSSHTKADRSLGIAWKQTRPDASNLAKTIEDVLRDLKFFIDDSQVACLVVTKKHGDKPGIGIEIEQLEASA